KLQKSSIFFSKNTPIATRSNICQTLHGIQHQLSCKYLGLPLQIGHSKRQTFQY
ncbi:Unknown protein, partial [Striga hermonthica]